ncbi:mandelate racemase/muconate lactonizing enzyme family protein [Botrimarina hoheduenensis]|uniref:Enolase C-terminal domain-containing protein n=1 Tax=Botrimarina hoheduenensis TaxID=2528000 RepID=A0A5C5WA14_9BACT|nr:mandelate racemase/muconate lactonizing enzyme family protein [Botrimarina hoheduenensis]TWT46879.1 hypothetical protein Pla111_19810 [Botrimarina hoheduenensis]
MKSAATTPGLTARRGRALPTDIRVVGARLYLLPIETRVPLKFGAETLTSVTCARAMVRVEGRDGRTAVGWGETPLSVQWVWPDPSPYDQRLSALQTLCQRLAAAWVEPTEAGHPFELGSALIEERLEAVRQDSPQAPPLLAALACNAPFDLALYDAFGRLHGRPVFELLGSEHLASDLAAPLESPALAGKRPADFLRHQRVDRLPAWHLVGGLDPVSEADLDGSEPDDGYPVLLSDWIERDGLKCLKIKLRGTDAEWDYQRMVDVWRVAEPRGVTDLTADFNCTVTDPAYVVEVLDRLRAQEPTLYERLLYVEQPFPYDLEKHAIKVHEVARRKPLLLDESAHDWRHVRHGHELGWTGVALKTCKTLTGALLSAAWAQEHNMALMVQDLTNPMLAQVSHVLLAAHVATLKGVETNGMQFYPEASAPEAVVHPGLYTRRAGQIDLSSLTGPGFGYAGAEAARELPDPVSSFGKCD